MQIRPKALISGRPGGWKRPGSGRLSRCLVGVAFLAILALSLDAAPVICPICEEPVRSDTVYILTDEVTKTKVEACFRCSRLNDLCFVCGLPVYKGFVKLKDGRFLCAREARTAVLDDAVGRHICEEMQDTLSRALSRFLSFPTNVEVALMDRVSLLEFKVPGNDFACPNILGYFRPRTNDDGSISCQVRVLSAMKANEIRQVAAHEFTHAWVFQNVTAARKKRLGRDAQEGFCELVSYLLMDTLNDPEQKARILENKYTRGQIDLFVRTYERYGFNEILDWIRYGVDEELTATNLNLIREVALPSVSRPAVSPGLTLVQAGGGAAKVPEELILKGILGTRDRRLALINGVALSAGEDGRVHIGKSNVVVHCVSVSEDSALIRIHGSGEVRLRLKSVQ